MKNVRGVQRMDAIWEVMLEAAKAVQNDRKVSDYVEAGCVAAAIRSASSRFSATRYKT